MEDFSLNRFYKDVLSALNFSITGYPDIKNKIDEFLNDIITKSSFYEKPHIKFISYTYSKINDIDSFTTEKLDDKSFFFNAFKEYSLEVFALNEYYIFKKYLDEKINTQKKNSETRESLSGSTIVSKLFCNPVSFGVAITTDNYVSIHYNQHDDIIYIKVPVEGIFKTDNQNSQEIRRNIFSNFENEITEHKNLTINKNDNFYEVDIEKFNKATLSNTDIFNEDKIKENVKLIKNKLILLNETSDNYFFRKEDVDFEIGTLVEALAKFIMAHAFLSFLLNVEIENLQSVVYDKGDKDKRSIGLLITGYSTKQRINADERAMLKIIAERISYCIASQTLFDNNKKLQVETNRRRFLEFCKKVDDTIESNNKIFNSNNSKQLHGTEKWEGDDLSLFKNFIQEYASCLGKDFVKNNPNADGLFSKYLSIIVNKNKKNQNIFPEKFCKFSCNENSFKCIYCMIEDQLQCEQLEYFLNLPLIDALIKTFNEKNDNYDLEIKTNKIKLKFNQNFDLFNLINALKNRNTGSFSTFLKKNFVPILSMGNLCFEDNDSKEIFDLEEWYLNNRTFEYKLINSFNLVIHLNHKIL